MDRVATSEAPKDKVGVDLQPVTSQGLPVENFEVHLGETLMGDPEDVTGMVLQEETLMGDPEDATGMVLQKEDLAVHQEGDLVVHQEETLTGPGDATGMVHQEEDLAGHQEEDLAGPQEETLMAVEDATGMVLREETSRVLRERTDVVLDVKNQPEDLRMLIHHVMLQECETMASRGNNLVDLQKEHGALDSVAFLVVSTMMV